MCKPELYLNSEIQPMTMENKSCKSTDVPKQVMCIPGDNTFYMTESVFGNKELYLIIRRGAACYTRPVNTSVSGRKK